MRRSHNISKFTAEGRFLQKLSIREKFSTITSLPRGHFQSVEIVATSNFKKKMLIPVSTMTSFNHSSTSRRVEFKEKFKQVSTTWILLLQTEILKLS